MLFTESPGGIHAEICESYCAALLPDTLIASSVVHAVNCILSLSFSQQPFPSLGKQGATVPT